MFLKPSIWYRRAGEPTTIITVSTLFPVIALGINNSRLERRLSRTSSLYIETSND